MSNHLTYSSYNKSLIKAEGFRLLRHTPKIGKCFKRKKYGDKRILSTEEGRNVLKQAILDGKPFMAARFGTSEGLALNDYWGIKLKYGNAYDRLSDKYLSIMCNNAGFFPKSKEMLWKWADMESDACADVDLLGVMHFLNEEWIVRYLCIYAQLMPNGGLASASRGWAHVLEGRKVLVVHPFTETIKHQYENNREKIFPGTNALPKFDLKCVKAVQTIADATDSRFATWFDALDYMTEEIEKQDFEVALIGCGAYGFQLASRVKRMGKIAVHMGGSVQTLFGIKGGRWDGQYSDMYNEYWVYPSNEETPAGFEKVEGGCYWNNKG